MKEATPDIIPYKIPENWEWITIETINTRFINESIKPFDFPNQMFESYSVPVYFTGKPEFVKGETILSSKQRVTKNDVLICKINPRINRVWIVNEKTDFEQIASSEWIVITPVSQVLSWYLVYVCKSNYFREIISANVSGVGGSLQRARPKEVMKYPIPLPPFAEQNRIVKKLDAAFDKLKKVEATLAEVPKMIEDFRQSILLHGMNGELTKKWRKENTVSTNVLDFLKQLKEKRKVEYDAAVIKAKELKLKKPKKDFEFTFSKHPKIKNWAIAKLDQLIYISARIGWKGLKADEYTKSGPMFLSVHSLNYGEEVEFSKAYHISQERFVESPEIMLQEDDVLLCKDGAGIGKIGIVKNLKEDATINSSLLLIRSREAFDPKFLFYFFSGPTLQEVVKSRITGSAIPHLFQRDIKEFNLSVPPLEEQKVIVKKIEEMMSVAESLENVYQSSLQEIGQIRNSLLNKAFRGELVPQDSKDEPASILLEKIKQEKLKLEEELKAQRKKRRSQPKKRRVMKNLEIIEVLKINGQPMKAEEVWKESKYKGDIDAFYENLRHEVETTKNVKSEVEEDQITYLTLNENGK